VPVLDPAVLILDPVVLALDPEDRYIYIYIYFYLFIKFASGLALGCSRASWPAWPREMQLLAARAWPGAAGGSKWLLEPAPEPQMARNGCSSSPLSSRIREKCRSSLPRSCRMLDGCRSSLPRNCRMIDGCSSSHPGGAECSTGAARACPGAAACSKSAARTHSREVRSLLAFEMAGRKMLTLVRLLSASTFARLDFASRSSLPRGRRMLDGRVPLEPPRPEAAACSKSATRAHSRGTGMC